MELEKKEGPAAVDTPQAEQSCPEMRIGPYQLTHPKPSSQPLSATGGRTKKQGFSVSRSQRHHHKRIERFRPYEHKTKKKQLEEEEVDEEWESAQEQTSDQEDGMVFSDEDAVSQGKSDTKAVRLQKSHTKLSQELEGKGLGSSPDKEISTSNPYEEVPDSNSNPATEQAPSPSTVLGGQGVMEPLQSSLASWVRVGSVPSGLKLLVNEPPTPDPKPATVPRVIAKELWSPEDKSMHGLLAPSPEKHLVRKPV